jgi:hypothetical protein
MEIQSEAVIDVAGEYLTLRYYTDFNDGWLTEIVEVWNGDDYLGKIEGTDIPDIGSLNYEFNMRLLSENVRKLLKN